MEFERRKDSQKRARRSSVQNTIASTRQFLQSISCFDILPVNSKLIFLDTSLLIKKALYALLQNGIRSAPLWDQQKRKLEGLLTATDFLNIILYFYSNRSSHEQVIEELNQLTIKSLREKRLIHVPKKLLSVSPSESVHTAARMLVDYKVHRILLIDQDNDGSDMIVSVMTPYRILNFMAVNFRNLKSFRKPIGELGLGTFENVVSINLETQVIDAIKLFIDMEISALPIVNEEGTLLDVYEKYDMMVLLKGDNLPRLDSTMKDALMSRSEIFEGVHTCRKTDTLESIMYLLKTTTVHRFIIVSETNRLEGILSLSDILSFFVEN